MAKNRLASAFTYLIFLLSSAHFAFAQFPVTLKVNSASGTSVSTPPTVAGKQYRITVQGTYSQWTGFTDCHGVDAVWVYDVPAEEISSFRFPPPKVLGQPFVEIPHWTGDSTAYSFPPKQLGLTPLFTLTFRKYLGFRVDGEPLPPFPLDRASHRYQIEKKGTGGPLTFRILDSTYSIIQERALPRYEDNCGELTVTVEEIRTDDVNICAVEQVVVNGQVIGLKLDASILVIDSNATTGVRNVLRDKQQLGISIDGKFICPDSIVCKQEGRSTPLAYGLVCDRSGSMLDVVSKNDTTLRIDALKAALQSFVKGTSAVDLGFLMSFESDVKLEQDWTNDKNRLSAIINALTPGSTTAFNKAVIQGVQKLKLQAMSNKALIVITDGINNSPPFDSSEVLREITSAGIPLYVIALSMLNSSEDVLARETMKMYVDAAPRGKFYSVNDARSLDSLYTRLSREIGTDECCRIFFPIPPCDPKKEGMQTVTLMYLSGDSIRTKKLKFSCKTPGITYVGDEDVPSLARPFDLDVTPNPSSGTTTIRFVLPYAASVQVKCMDVSGRTVASFERTNADIGFHQERLDGASLSAGTYTVVLSVDGVHTSTKLLIIR